ncbi:uncharacterized protein PV07_12706 [Cladophialophora immunda]|uniref:ATP-dependent DNA helicase n=1 Tax=Cladophialophora immunda TaxID=569365 RepID=A0A0D2AAT3_9EURO|nr:uncharacterized protein PV07_12706 [Cladophialophora immunda]KIW21882.1 hypothetical protein PV07_12706 [Cladophialophora immunda]
MSTLTPRHLQRHGPTGVPPIWTLFCQISWKNSHQNPGDDGLENLNVDDDADVGGSSGELARRLSNRATMGVRQADPEGRGERGFDRQYGWTPQVGRYTFPDDYWKELKLSVPATLAVHPSADRTLYDYFITHHESELACRRNKQFVINLDGKAGTGKSHVVTFIAATLEPMGTSVMESLVQLLVWPPLGLLPMLSVAEHCIAQFKLPLKLVKGYEDLSTQNLAALQNAELKHVRYLIPPREIFKEKSRTKFRCIDIAIAGDFWQLPAVGVRPLFYVGETSNPEEIAGNSLSRRFNRTIELDAIRRQQGQDAESVAFRKALDALRDDSGIPAPADALRIYGKKTGDAQYNHDRLRDL